MADETPEPTQRELFDQALAPPPAEPELQVPPAEPQPPPQPEPPPQPQPEEVAVPTWRLREESERARAAESRAAALESRLNEIATHLRQQQPQPDFFDDPGRATEERVARMLQPFAAETRQQLMELSKTVASVRHGEDKVEQAEAAFLEARDRQTLDPADFERVVGARNRYDAVVQWHKRQSTLAAVGDDPNAWFDKQLEAKMNDPKFQATILDRVRSGAASRPSETRLPPSLSRSTAAASNAVDSIGDMSDQSLFAFATAPKPRGRPQ